MLGRSLSTAKWSQYEEQVYCTLRDHFPRADVKKNVRIRGRFSKRSRQVDVLITEHTPSGTSKIVVDTKLFTRRVNVKDIDAFAGFVDDVDAKRGLLITNGGYTKAALRRAHFAPGDLELDVLNFDELKQWQAFGGIPYVGDKGFLVPAPLGWVIDLERIEDALCTMYQRGIDLPTARKRKEFLYISAWNRAKDRMTAEQLDKQQVDRLIAAGLTVVSVRRGMGARWTRSKHRKPREATVRLRRLHIKEYRCLELTGFLEFPDIIFFAVLHTPIEKEEQNLRRLEHILSSTIRINLTKDNAPLIESLKQELSAATERKEKARVALDIGHWYRDMGFLSEAKSFLLESLDTDLSYLGLKELMIVLLALGQHRELPHHIRNLLLLDLENPTVFNDAMEFARSGKVESEFLNILLELSDAQTGETLAKGNCLFYAAQVLVGINRLVKARELLCQARQTFRQLTNPNKAALRSVNFSLRQLAIGLHETRLSGK